MPRLAHHVPRFHVRLPRGYLNDPNAPIELDGSWHLYFQSRSVADLAVPVEWGHASSPDLVRWTLHRPALSPVPGGPDDDGAWSGNALVQGAAGAREVHAYYSGKLVDSPYQAVLRAVSTDGGFSFGAPEPMIPPPAPEDGITMLRDPFIWRDGEGYSLVVGAARADGAAAILRYVSPDGIGWTAAGELARRERGDVDGEDTGEGWECPQLLPGLPGGGDWALVSSWSEEHGPGQVLAFPVGDASTPRRVDHGPNFYAASVLRESSAGPLLWAWITEGRDEEWWKADGWAGALTLPRAAAPDGSGRPASAPHPAVDALRAGAARVADGAAIGAQAELVVADAATGTIRLRFSDSEWCDLVIDREADTVSLDRRHASTDARAHGGVAVAPLAFDGATGRPDLRVFLDGSVIEVFTSAGRTITSRVYPIGAPPWTVEGAGVVYELSSAG